MLRRSKPRLRLRSPLTRWAVQQYGGMDNFQIVILQTLTVPRDDDELLHQGKVTMYKVVQELYKSCT
eukprot:COSAG03_NODE_15241_length_437_cov_0.810651_1_plen_66_part_10